MSQRRQSWWGSTQGAGLISRLMMMTTKIFSCRADLLEETVLERDQCSLVQSLPHDTEKYNFHKQQYFNKSLGWQWLWESSSSLDRVVRKKEESEILDYTRSDSSWRGTNHVQEKLSDTRSWQEQEELMFVSRILQTKKEEQRQKNVNIWCFHEESWWRGWWRRK